MIIKLLGNIAALNYYEYRNCFIRHFILIFLDYEVTCKKLLEKYFSFSKISNCSEVFFSFIRRMRISAQSMRFRSESSLIELQLEREYYGNSFAMNYWRVDRSTHYPWFWSFISIRGLFNFLEGRATLNRQLYMKNK